MIITVSLLSHCSMTLRQYWTAASFKLSLDLPPLVVDISEAVKEEVNEEVKEEG